MKGKHQGASMQWGRLQAWLRSQTTCQWQIRSSCWRQLHAKGLVKLCGLGSLETVMISTNRRQLI